MARRHEIRNPRTGKADCAIADPRRCSIELSERFIVGVERAACPEREFASSRDPVERGSRVSFRHPQGYAVMQALIAKGMIGDFRAPDRLRFGFAPLRLGDEEIDRAVATLTKALDGRSSDRPAFHARAAVT